MSSAEEVEAVEQQLQAAFDDWQLLQTLRERLPRRVAQIRRSGVPGRVIARKTRIPERNVRRWSKQAPGDETAGAA